MKRSVIAVSLLFMVSSVMCFAVPVDADDVSIKTTDQTRDVYADEILLSGSGTVSSIYFNPISYNDAVYSFRKGSSNHADFVDAMINKKNPSSISIDTLYGGDTAVIFLLHGGGNDTLGYKYTGYDNSTSMYVNETKMITSPPAYKAEVTKYQFYSGQTVNLILGDSYSGSIYLKSEKQRIYIDSSEKEIMITSTGEYEIYIEYGNTLFVTYSMEYSTFNTDISVYGYLFTIIGAAIIGLLFWSGRKQRIG